MEILVSSLLVFIFLIPGVLFFLFLYPYHKSAKKLSLGNLILIITSSIIIYFLSIVFILFFSHYVIDFKLINLLISKDSSIFSIDLSDNFLTNQIYSGVGYFIMVWITGGFLGAFVRRCCQLQVMDLKFDPFRISPEWESVVDGTFINKDFSQINVIAQTSTENVRYSGILGSVKLNDDEKLESISINYPTITNLVNESYVKKEDQDKSILIFAKNIISIGFSNYELQTDDSGEMDKLKLLRDYRNKRKKNWYRFRAGFSAVMLFSSLTMITILFNYPVVSVSIFFFISTICLIMTRLNHRLNKKYNKLHDDLIDDIDLEKLRH